MPAAMSCGAACAPWPVLWAPVFSAIAIALVSGFAAYIAFRQWLTARTRVQLDLYERRRPIYDAVANLLADITVKGIPKTGDSVAFSNATSEADFLFGPDLAEYVQTLQWRVSQTAWKNHELERTPDGPGRDAINKELLESLEWFRAQYDVFPAKFRPYLQLEGRKVHLVRWPWSRD